jgi:2-phospho-L-lactate transferase/gluconeogenesis factor (CofD/UPF0052 family)
LNLKRLLQRVEAVEQRKGPVVYSLAFRDANGLLSGMTEEEHGQWIRDTYPGQQVTVYVLEWVKPKNYRELEPNKSRAN